MQMPWKDAKIDINTYSATKYKDMDYYVQNTLIRAMLEEENEKNQK